MPLDWELLILHSEKRKDNLMSETGRKVLFTKMHGAGNDYIYINAMQEVPEDLPYLSSLISDRHFGVGSDGLVAILPSEVADFRMRMFNADGSEAEMCGNASRCIGKYVFEKGLTDKREITLETKAGIKVLKLHIEGSAVDSVTVDMGAPLIKEGRTFFTTHDGIDFELKEISMGNPHAVVFTSDLTDANVLGNGPALECASIFPNKSNIEFAEVINRNRIRMRVWERGSGETLACGTGACATTVAAVCCGLADRKVEMNLKGGTLNVNWDAETNHVLLTGPAEFVCEGIYYMRDNEKGRRLQ